MKRTIITVLFLISGAILLSCSPSPHLPGFPDIDSLPLLASPYKAPAPSKSVLEQRHPENLSPELIHFDSEVKPILDSRCVVCHACYDAPCQLKLGAMEGIERGATKVKVYDGKRLFPAEPTRLFTDALSVEQWREKEFFPVLDEQENEGEATLNNSLLYQMIKLKKEQPLPEQGLLPKSFKLDNYRDLSCPAPDDFPAFKEEHPQYGMPYGLPKLSQKEHETLTTWLKQGAVFPPRKALSKNTVGLINQWETFLNQPDKKSQLISRYLYEHL
ncbi:MAG: fatty acid cis/trans isomerase, partial [Pseudomonadales bacterium]|nr:fatty acid cis/trans isomerase [Pseudomonadales bacterium]